MPEMSLLFNHKRCATVKAISLCDIYLLNRTDFARLMRYARCTWFSIESLKQRPLSEYPDVKDAMVRIAKVRAHKLNELRTKTGAGKGRKNSLLDSAGLLNPTTDKVQSPNPSRPQPLVVSESNQDIEMTSLPGSATFASATPMRVMKQRRASLESIDEAAIVDHEKQERRGPSSKNSAMTSHDSLPNDDDELKAEN